MSKTNEREFRNSKEQVFAACQLAIAELGFSVKHSDANTGILSFNTGRSMKSWAGQDLTVTLLPNGSTIRAVVGGSLAQSGATLQIGAWGEKNSLSKKFLEAVEDALKTNRLQNISNQSQISDSNPTLSLADEISKLSDLRDQGILSDEEFLNAKARLLS